MQLFLTIFPICLCFIAYLSYIRDILKGKVSPHVISWFLWSLSAFLVFAIQFQNNAGFGSYINLALAFISFVIFILSIKKGKKDISRLDFFAFVLALTAIVLWLFVDRPLWSVILIIFTDIMALVPSVLKAWEDPLFETTTTFILASVKHLLSFFALESLVLVNVLYPVYGLIANSFFVILIIFRRKGSRS